MSSAMSSPMSSAMSSPMSSAMSSPMPTVSNAPPRSSCGGVSPARKKMPWAGTLTVMVASKPPSTIWPGVREVRSKLPDSRVQWSKTFSSAAFSSSAILQVPIITESTVQPEPVTVTSTSPGSATLEGLSERGRSSCADAALAPIQVTSANAIAMSANLVLVMISLLGPRP